MLMLPAALLALLVEFAPLFSRPVWKHAQVLLGGAMLATGTRTVTACLRVMGLSQETRFVHYHRVLHRAHWSALAASHLLLRRVVMTFAPHGALVFGLDDTIERRGGEHITAKGLSRDPVRSSHSHMVKASGWRWLCCMMLVPVPWAGTVWGLPILTALCPSERSHTARGRTPQTLTARAWQVRQVVRRWRPTWTLGFVADSSFAALDLLGAGSRPPGASLITRLRLDAERWAPAPERLCGQQGRPRVKGARRPSPQQRRDDAQTVWTPRTVAGWYGGGNRDVEVSSEPSLWYKSGHQPVLIRWVLVRDPQGKLAPQAFLSTDPDHTPVPVLTWFVRRWRLEVTLEEARAHLGLETQRQWSELAIARPTPVLVGLFSLVTLLADGLLKDQAQSVRTAAWYTKARPTFADAIAVLRRYLWSGGHFSTSTQSSEVVQIPRSFLERFTDAVCYAA
jgi:hypothetical protein